MLRDYEQSEFFVFKAPAKITALLSRPSYAETVSALELRRHMIPGPSCSNPAEI